MPRTGKNIDQVEMEQIEKNIADLKNYIVKMSSNSHPRWMDIAAACKYASMSKHTIMGYVISGDIYGTRKGGKWYIDRESLDKFMLQDSVDIATDLIAFMK